MVICNHVTKGCIADKCYHSKPHDIEMGLGKPCQQQRCNGTREGLKENIKVECVEVKE